MKKFKELSPELRLIIIRFVEDEDMEPETLYENIYSSTGPDESLSSIYGVPTDLVKLIKLEGQD